MKHWKSLLLCSVLGTASLQAAACYTVYDASNQVVYNARTAPVDMSQPISQTLPRVFPGGHMVVSAGNDCPREQPAALVADRTPSTAPLLTDRRTAAAMNVPHTILASGAALVRNAPANTEVVAANRVAPPVLLPSTVPAPAVMAAARPRTETVITEMHNPPLTSVQVGANVVVSQLR